MASLTVPIDNTVMQRFTFKVKFARTFRARVWLGAQMVKLGATLIGSRVEIEVVDTLG